MVGSAYEEEGPLSEAGSSEPLLTLLPVEAGVAACGPRRAGSLCTRPSVFLPSPGLCLCDLPFELFLWLISST